MKSIEHVSMIMYYKLLTHIHVFTFKLTSIFRHIAKCDLYDPNNITGSLSVHLSNTYHLFRDECQGMYGQKVMMAGDAKSVDTTVLS